MPVLFIEEHAVKLNILIVSVVGEYQSFGFVCKGKVCGLLNVNVLPYLYLFVVFTPTPDISVIVVPG
jgi:hypothetical protein